MKSTISIRQLVSTLALTAAASALACGPFPPTIPTPDFFEISSYPRSMADFDREENIRLWQELTSPDIPLSDIETAVYTAIADNVIGNPDYEYMLNKNMFYNYLNNTNDQEILEYLSTAKDLEHRRAKLQSPWYYPETRDYYDDAPRELTDIIKTSTSYTGTRLKDRYAMLAVRSMFASNMFDRCIQYYNSVFTDIPDSNLMKRMAERYVAGAWSRLGDTDRADRYFAKAGDVMSISDDDPLGYMLRQNPGAPQLMEWLRYNADDTTLMLRAAAATDALLRDNRVANKGDWYFLRSYVSDTYGDNTAAARNDIRKALTQQFSDDEMKDLARVWRMKLDAGSGNTSTLLADLKWLEEKAAPVNPDAGEWKLRVRNIVYADFVPALWKRRDYTTAILLCAYADNYDSDKGRLSNYDYSDVWRLPYYTPVVSELLDEVRKSTRYDNPTDYATLSFQMMQSLSSEQLASVYANMQQSRPLYDFLKRRARTDRDFYYEVIGTLALREENYARAEQYLSRVSDDYIRTMNTVKGGYFNREIFDSYTGYRLPGQFTDNTDGAHNSKLQYARMMKSLKNSMLYGRTVDERGLARIRYATARFAAFNRNWALTQYWQGFCGNMFMASWSYWDDDSDENDYDFLYDFDTSDDYEKLEATYKKDIADALAMLTTDEARAEAEYLLGNLKTVIARYPSSTTAEYIRTSCDNWSTWL